MEYIICNQTIEISEHEISAHRIKCQFEERAERAAKEYFQKYENYGNWMEFVRTGLADGYQIILEECNFAASILVKEGRYAVTGEALLTKYGEEILEPWDDLVEEIGTLMESTELLFEQAQYAREVRKACRGQIIGGGFGISGALQGMVFAGAANAVTGSAHSLANAIGNARTRNAIIKKQEELYRNDVLKKSIYERIYTTVVSLGAFICVEKGIDSEKVQPRNQKMAEALMQNYAMIPEKDRLQVLLDALSMNTYNVSIYEHLIREFRGSEEAAKIGRLFGLDLQIEAICEDKLKDMIPPDLSTMSLAKKEDLLKEYRQCKSKLGVTAYFSAEREIEQSIVISLLPVDWDAVAPEKIPTILEKIKKQKQRVGIQAITDVESTLLKRLDKAKTVQNKQYSTVEEAKLVRQQREQIMELCSELEAKSYEELLVLKKHVFETGPVSAHECAEDYVALLQEQITQKDEERRTFNYKVYDSLGQMELAKQNYTQGMQLIENCNMESVDEVVHVKSQLEELNRRIPAGAVEDFCVEINLAYKKFCTYKGRQLDSLEEKHAIIRKYKLLCTQFLDNLTPRTELEVKRVLAIVRQDTTVHPVVKELFEEDCNVLIRQIKKEIIRSYNDAKQEYEHAKTEYERMYDQYAIKIKPLAAYKRKDKTGTYVLYGSFAILIIAKLLESLLILAVGIIALIMAIISCASIDRAKKEAVQNMPKDLSQAKRRMEAAEAKLKATEKIFNGIKEKT